MEELMSRRAVIQTAVAGTAGMVVAIAPTAAEAQEGGVQAGQTWSVPELEEANTETKTVEMKATYDPNNGPPPPQAYFNPEGVYVLNGFFGVAAYEFQGSKHYDNLTYERLHSINGKNIHGQSQTHVGSVYVGPSGITRFFFSQTSIGKINGQKVYPLYMSVNGVDFFRVLTPTGTRML